MFVALALQRDLIAAGREDEIDEIRQFISTILPEPENEPGPTPSEPRNRRPLIADPGPLGAEHAGQIERIFRGVYVLSTLKRDEMIREGQQEEFERIHKDAHKTQDSIRKDAPRQVGVNGMRDDRNVGRAARIHRRGHVKTAFPAL